MVVCLSYCVVNFDNPLMNIISLKIMHTKHVCMLAARPLCMDAPPTAGVFRWVVCHLRSLTLPCEWHYGTAFYIRSNKNLSLERERQLTSGSWLVCHPYSPLQCYWNVVVVIFNIAAFIYMPLQVFLVSPDPYDAFILLCDGIAFLDICLNFVTGYDEESKLIILNRRAIAKHYLRNNFFLDVIGAMPLQMYRPHCKNKFPTHTIMFIFKLARLPSLKKKWVEMFQQFRLSYVASVGISVVVRTLLFFHWMTYIYYQVPAFFSLYYNRDIFWRKRFHMKIPSNAIAQVYMTNLYWVCGLCVGAGYYSPVDDYIIPDLLLTSSIGIVGLLFIIYSFSTLLRLFIYGKYDKYLYNGRLKDIEEYMKLKRIPEYLKRKILLFLNYKFHGTYFNEEAIINTINEQIRQDINMHFCKRLVTNIPIFQDLPVTFVNTIIFSLTQTIYMPGEIVVSCGDPVDCLYIISSGTVSVMNSVGKELSHLRDGAYFGEDALYDPNQLRTTAIIALEITEMYKLPTAAFRECVRSHPPIHLRRRTPEERSSVVQD